MTRINVGIDPLKLTDQHLIAELRELPRVFTIVNRRNCLFDEIPSEFKLGTGHVRFFYNKLRYLEKRHLLLRDEYYNRFKKVYEFDNDRYKVDIKLYNDYVPKESDKRLVIDRISKRIKESKQIPRYYREVVSKEKAVDLIESCICQNNYVYL